MITRKSARTLAFLIACMALPACNDLRQGAPDTGPTRFSGTVVEKRPLGTALEFGPRKAKDKGPNCWQLIVKDTVGKKRHKVCVRSTTWELMYVGAPFWRTQKYTGETSIRGE